MLRQVLLAYHSTPSSEAALALGFEVARALKAAVQVVTVVGSSGPTKGPELAADRRAAWQSLRGLEREAPRGASRCILTFWWATRPRRF